MEHRDECVKASIIDFLLKFKYNTTFEWLSIRAMRSFCQLQVELCYVLNFYARIYF